MAAVTITIPRAMEQRVTESVAGLYGGQGVKEHIIQHLIEVTQAWESQKAGDTARSAAAADVQKQLIIT